MDCEYCTKFIYMLFPICMNEDEEEFENMEIPEAVPVSFSEDCPTATLITI